MKRNTEKTSSDMLLMDFVDSLKEKDRRDAMETYLNSAAHRHFLHIHWDTTSLRDATAALKEGNVFAHFNLASDEECFASVLLERPESTYWSNEFFECEKTSPDEETRYESEDVMLAPAEQERFRSLGNERRAMELEKTYGCPYVTLSQLHDGDDAAKRDYLRALVKYIETAASFAKGIGSESCRLWLEVLRLLSDHCGLRIATTLHLTEENVMRAYTLAQKAQATLWIDDQYRALPSLKLKSRKAGKAH